MVALNGRLRKSMSELEKFAVAEKRAKCAIRDIVDQRVPQSSLAS